MKEDVEKIKVFLDSHKVNYQLLEHEAVFTSGQAAKARNAKLEEGAKSMIVRSEGVFYDFILSAAKKLDWNKIKDILNSKSASLADPKEVVEVINCEVGSVPPFGNLYNLRVYCDPSLLENEYLEFNAGLHTVSMRMKSKDWKEIVNPSVVSFAK